MHNSVASLCYIITGSPIHSDSLPGICSDAECQRFHITSCISGPKCFFELGMDFLSFFLTDDKVNGSISNKLSEYSQLQVFKHLSISISLSYAH